MSRGKKLDLFIGADFDDGWSEVTQSKPKQSSETLLPKEHRLHFAKEKRRGKSVTLVGPFYLTQKEQTALLKKLKKELGCGGTFKDGFMEFQGDLSQRLRPLLLKEGFGFKAKH